MDSDSSDNPINSIESERYNKPVQKCPFCKSSNIYKRTRIGKYPDANPPYRCNKCKKAFTKPIESSKIVVNPEKL